MRYSYQVPIIFPSSRKIIVFERCDNITDFLYSFNPCPFRFVLVILPSEFILWIAPVVNRDINSKLEYLDSEIDGRLFERWIVNIFER